MKIVLILIFFLVINTIGWSSTSYPLSLLGASHTQVMARPNLLPFSLAENDWSIQARYTSLKTSIENNDNDMTSQLVGIGGTFLFQRTRELGFFLTLTGTNNELKGEFLSNGEGDYKGEKFQIESRNASMMEGALGITYHFWQSSFLPMQLSLAPTWQRESADFKMDGSESSTFTFNRSQSYLKIGLQAGLKVFGWMTINPYYFLSAPLTDLNQCETLNVANEQKLILTSSNSSCRQDEFLYSTQFQVTGINLYFPKIYLVIGLTETVRGEMEKSLSSQGLTTRELSLSLVF